MRAYEFITESKIINEGARIAHAEDLVFYEGAAGALRAVANLTTLPKNRDTLSIKWDGRPAIVAGRDENGDFILTDKAGFGAKGYNGLYKSAKEFVDQKRSKGGDEGYLAKIVELWPIVESAFPPNYRGFIQADVMWFPGDIQDTGKRYVFTPNTVTYEVDKASDIGRKISQTKAGIAAHTYIAAPGAEGQPLKNLQGVNVNGDLCILGPEIRNEAPLQHDKAHAKQIQQFIKKNAKVIDDFLNSDTLSALKMTGLPDLLYTYVNAQTKTGDLTHLLENFSRWVQSNPKISKVMAQKVLDYSSEKQAGLKAIFDVFTVVAEYKNDMIRQLDSHDGPVIAHIAGNRGGEGYVSSDQGGPIKLVNRLGFSAANFAGNA